MTLLAMHIAPLSHSDNWESSLVARALWEAAISSGHHRSGAEQRGGEPPLGENFSSLQRFHWIHISRVWCYSGGLFCLNSNEDHESWLHYKQRLLKLLLIQFNDKQWHFRASESVEHFFFSQSSFHMSVICDFSHFPIAPDQSLDTSRHLFWGGSFTIESLYLRIRWKDFIVSYD